MSSVFHDPGQWGDGPTFDAPKYREVTTATHLEIAQQPEAVAERLVGRMVRALGTQGRYGSALNPAETT
jgi:hypothetical protein